MSSGNEQHFHFHFHCDEKGKEGGRFCPGECGKWLNAWHKPCCCFSCAEKVVEAGKAKRRSLEAEAAEAEAAEAEAAESSQPK